MSTSDDLASTAPSVEQQLREAIQNDRYDELKRLLGSGGDLLERPLQYEFNEDGSTLILYVSPFVLATALGKTSIVALLLENGAMVETELHGIGGTALHLAARYSPKDIMDLLLSKADKAEINRQDQKGSSLLHLASRYNQHEVVAYLLDEQAAPNQLDNDGNTPFHVASMYGSKESLQLLWERGAKEQINVLNKYLNGPLHLACLNNHSDTAELLLDWGANVNQPGPNGATPLFHACSGGNDTMIDMLAERGADIHARNHDGDTPILFSCWQSQANSLEPLSRRNASVLDVNKDGNNCFHMVVYNQEPSGDPEDTLSALFSNGANINHANNLGFSPLVVACIKQNLKLVKHLLDLGADINHQGPLTKATALMEACCNSDAEIVEILLRRGADTTLTNNNGLAALALACRFNQLEHVRALIRHGVMVGVRDKVGFTPLFTAAVYGDIDIALEILATSAYFPSHPAREIAFTERSSNPAIVRRIEEELLKDFGHARYNELEHLQIVLHWAVSNGAFELAQRCILHNRQVLQLKRRGATWVHIAAQYGEHGFIKHIVGGETPADGIDVLAVAEGQITALHVATVNGSVETLKVLLSTIPDQIDRAQAIIKRNIQGESPLSISIKRKNKDQQDLLWKEIRQLGTVGVNFIHSHKGLGGKILELLAKYEKPGREDVLKELLRKWFRGESEQDFTTLHWAVYRSQAVVVWWLLSKGGYSSGYTIESARNLVPAEKYSKTDVRYYIRQLLLHPPPVLDRVANPNDEQITSVPALMDETNASLSKQGSIVDIYITGETTSIPYTKASIRDIIYEEGPESLMKNPKENWGEHNLDELKRTLEQSIYEGRDPHSLGSMIPQSSDEPSYEAAGALKLRWIHLPVNELHLMRDLTFRLSHDSNRPETDHAVLMKHFDRSWTQLAAGGKRKYMKPQCVRKDGLSTNQLPGGFSSCMALYMPYLTMGDIPELEPQGSADSHSSRQIKHEPMTLDQYYYPTITNTHTRDHDQVLSRFLKKQDNRGKILMVNQIWMWIIDEKTIITATAEDPQDSNSKVEDLFEATLHKILYDQTNSRLEHAISVDSVIELILGVATGLFMKKYIAFPVRFVEKKGPIDVFRESIRDVADGETALFREFLMGLRHEKVRQGTGRDDQQNNAQRRDGSHDENQERDKEGQLGALQNRYHIISSETELLETTRDIRDELHILRFLAEDQEIVWNQAFPQNGSGDRFQFYHSSTPNDVKKDLDDMLAEAGKTTEYITTLLDLRVAEYSRIQASESARLSRDLARQANSIFIFTVITIVFLPLSFLSSLFALDVTDFPHDESGDLKYQGWWIFPILCKFIYISNMCSNWMLTLLTVGVTIIVSVPAIALAWNVNSILGWFRLGTRRDSVERSVYTERRRDVMAQLDDHLKGKRRRFDRDKLSSVEKGTRGQAQLLPPNQLRPMLE
ncbi:hypothetical protein GGR54DRAFT_611210 [Hypoxylon sp. NC1633]|nr:hypothetical protein GGR54DRAFT_611210 [Hypoxylon sp. NC1633]